jgi:hypothetical protein
MALQKVSDIPGLNIKEIELKALRFTNCLLQLIYRFGNAGVISIKGVW